MMRKAAWKPRQLRLIAAACGMLSFSLGAPAYGVNCYQVWDARENLVYQSIYPPFDLARPAFDRAMADLRSQRRTFIFFDTLDCALISAAAAGPAGSGSTDPASILDIRSAIPGYGRASGGGGMLSPVPGTSGAPAPAGAAPQSGMNLRGSTPTATGAGRASAFY